MAELIDLHERTKQQLQSHQHNLAYTPGLAEIFWHDVDNTMHVLKDLLDKASSEESPALDARFLQAQQDRIEVGCITS